MSVRLAFCGTFGLKGSRLAFDGAPPGGEVTRIDKLDMDLVLNSGTEGCDLEALRIALERDASHDTPENLLASRFQFGQGSRGEEWVFPAELWLIDDAHPGMAGVLGKWVLHKTQVVEVEPSDDDGPPRERVVLHSYESEYINIAGGNLPLSAIAQTLPLKAPYARNGRP